MAKRKAQKDMTAIIAELMDQREASAETSSKHLDVLTNIDKNTALSMKIQQRIMNSIVDDVSPYLKIIADDMVNTPRVQYGPSSEEHLLSGILSAMNSTIQPITDIASVIVGRAIEREHDERNRDQDIAETVSRTVTETITNKTDDKSDIEKAREKREAGPGLFASLKGIISTVLGPVGKLIDILGAILKPFEFIITGIKLVLTALTVAGGLFAGFKVLDWLSNPETKEKIVGFIVSFVDGLKAFGVGIADVYTTYIDPTNPETPFAKILTAVSDWSMNLWEDIKFVWDNLKNFRSGVSDTFKEVIDFIGPKGLLIIGLGSLAWALGLLTAPITAVVGVATAFFKFGQMIGEWISKNDAIMKMLGFDPNPVTESFRADAESQKLRGNEMNENLKNLDINKQERIRKLQIGLDNTQENREKLNNQILEADAKDKPALIQQRDRATQKIQELRHNIKSLQEPTIEPAAINTKLSTAEAAQRQTISKTSSAPVVISAPTNIVNNSSTSVMDSPVSTMSTGSNVFNALSPN